jgi:hypothetical protein
LAKNPFDPPSKPGRPDVVDWDKDHIDLKWPAPKDDGGAPVEKYVIQKRDKGEGTGWATAMTVPGDRLVRSLSGFCTYSSVIFKISNRTDASVIDVEEGHEYDFRVIAVNKAGESEPSDPSRNVVAKPRKRMCN